MMMRPARLAATGLSLAVATLVARPAPAAAPDQAAGARTYQALCGGCHSLTANRIGPMHAGVVGRRAGRATGFEYSPALRNSRIVWTPANLDRWLQGPQAMVRGSRMFLNVPNAQDRANIIAYLQAQRVAQ